MTHIVNSLLWYSISLSFFLVCNINKSRISRWHNGQQFCFLWVRIHLRLYRLSGRPARPWIQSKKIEKSVLFWAVNRSVMVVDSSNFSYKVKTIDISTTFKSQTTANRIYRIINSHSYFIHSNCGHTQCMHLTKHRFADIMRIS